MHNRADGIRDDPARHRSFQLRAHRQPYAQSQSASAPARLATADERSGVEERGAPRRAVIVYVRYWDAR